MARTNVPVLETDPNGILDLDAVDVPVHITDGAMFTNDGHTRVWVKNAGAGAHNVTVVTPRVVEGLAVADRVYVVGIGKSALIGPFDAATFNQPSGADAGKAYVNVDGTGTEVTLVPFKD